MSILSYRAVCLSGQLVGAEEFQRLAYDVDRRAIPLSAQSLLNQSITAMGGEQALKALKGVMSSA